MTKSEDEEWAINEGVARRCSNCGKIYGNYFKECPICERKRKLNLHLTKGHSLKKTIKQGFVIKYCAVCDNMDFPTKTRRKYLVGHCKICYRPLKGVILSMASQPPSLV